MELFSDLTYWHWLVLGVGLIILEVLSQTIFLLLIGISAVVVGLLVLVLPSMAWELQVVLFAGLSVASIAVWKHYLKKYPTETDQPQLNRRGEQYVGRTFTLEEPIVNGQGKIKVDDSIWKITGDDCPEGSTVQVTGVNGVILEVKLQNP
jgi:membrane protein implicated in regulation of membrane protease activity